MKSSLIIKQGIENKMQHTTLKTMRNRLGNQAFKLPYQIQFTFQNEHSDYKSGHHVAASISTFGVI